MMNKIISTTLALAWMCAASTHAASIYTEAFDIDNNAQGWFSVSNGSAETVSQNASLDVLNFSGTGYSLFYLAADNAASTGAFSGDYITAAINGIVFDLNIASDSSINQIFFEISNLTEGETWQYGLNVPAFDATTSFFVPLDISGIGWTQTAGDQNFSFLLGQTEEIGIVFSNNTSGNITGSIDNVTTVPEPSSALLGVLGMLICCGFRKRS